MRAIRLHQFGPPENLRDEEVADPEPGPGQVRIAVAAAGVHLIDAVLRAGGSQGPLPPAELAVRDAGRCTRSPTASPTTPRWP
jgi:NADPH2:quinone reductase